MSNADKGKVAVFNSRLIILKGADGANINELKDTLIDLTTANHGLTGDSVYLFIDLSSFNVVSSMFLGLIGNTIQNPSIKRLALCGMQEAVSRIVARFGIEDGRRLTGGSDETPNDIRKKFRIHESLTDALVEIESFMERENE